MPMYNYYYDHNNHYNYHINHVNGLYMKFWYLNKCNILQHYLLLFQDHYNNNYNYNNNHYVRFGNIPNSGLFCNKQVKLWLTKNRSSKKSLSKTGREVRANKIFYKFFENEMVLKFIFIFMEFYMIFLK